MMSEYKIYSHKHSRLFFSHVNLTDHTNSLLCGKTRPCEMFNFFYPGHTNSNPPQLLNFDFPNAALRYLSPTYSLCGF